MAPSKWIFRPAVQHHAVTAENTRRQGCKMTPEDRPVSSGIAAFDEIVQGLRPGDNVVFQVDTLEDYRYSQPPSWPKAWPKGTKWSICGSRHTNQLCNLRKGCR